MKAAALNGIADQILIQPEFPGLASLDAPLPTFEIRAEKQAINTASGPMVTDEQPQPIGVSSGQTSERFNILSANPHPVELSERLVVPPGNLIPSNAQGDPTTTSSSASSFFVGQVVSQVESGVAGASNTSATTAPGIANGANGIITQVAGTLPQSDVHVIERSATGNFDAIVVQSSPVTPGDGNLLRGHPVYTVYVAVDGPKDWVLYFCLPDEQKIVNAGPVVHISPNPVVRAPWPTHLLIPKIAPLGAEKYILVHGNLDDTGRFQNLKIIRPASVAYDRLLDSLAAWIFRAATKDGVASSVEILLSIPVAESSSTHS